MSDTISLRDKKQALKLAYQIVTDKRNNNRYMFTSLARNDSPEIFTYFDMLDTLKAMFDELVDAKEKPAMQKPLSREEFNAIHSAREDHVWPFDAEPPMLFLESAIEKLDFCWISWAQAADLLMNGYRKYSSDSYGKNWRCWRYKPTNEERAAVPWEDSHE